MERHCGIPGPCRASSGPASSCTDRPILPRFNGTVVVEWLNVTAGADLATDWIMAHNELVRSGAVWVGVSAQAVGVNRAKTDDPVRYASLVHPGDSFSYDIFTTAGRDIRQQYATVLGGLQPQRMIAAGESQSAGRLVTYINAVQPTEHVYDGFMVHSRSGGGSSLSQSPQAAVPVPSPLQIRDDLARAGVRGGSRDGRARATSRRASRTRRTSTRGRSPARRTPTCTRWLLALTTRAPVPAQPRCSDSCAIHCMARLHERRERGIASLGPASRVPPPRRVGPQRDRAPSGTPIQSRRPGRSCSHVTRLGNVLGGVRSPHVDAPISTLTGSNDGPGFCRLFGSTTPFTPAQFLEPLSDACRLRRRLDGGPHHRDTGWLHPAHRRVRVVRRGRELADPELIPAPTFRRARCSAGGLTVDGLDHDVVTEYCRACTQSGHDAGHRGRSATTR